MRDSDLTVGVLSLHSSKETKAILNAVEDLGYGTEWLRSENTAVSIEDGDVDIEPDVDIIVNRLLLSSSDTPAEGLGLAATFDRALPMLNDPEAVLTAMHKMASATALSEAGLPVPDALMALSTSRLESGRDRFGEEAVYKTAIGTHGGGTWKVGREESVTPQVGNRQAFLQSLIEHDEQRHHDLRIYVVDGEVIAAMNRFAPENDWRTNVALGGEVEDMTGQLPEEVERIATEAADIVGLDYAGVDIVQGTDGWYILEVNPTAGFRGLFKASGVSPAPYIAKQAIEQAGGEVDMDEIERIARTLDDSEPTAKPEKEVIEATEPPIIGYIEEVTLAGTQGSKTVEAKSDTGATRTSIDSRLAAEIGTGPIKDIVKIKSGSVKSSKSRPLVDLVVGVGGTQHTVTASIEDRSHMDYPLLLGRDILKHYRVDVTKGVEEEREIEEEEEGEE